MTATEFNEKYKNYLGERHYGCDIPDEKVIEFLDKEFQKIIKENPEFEYYQIKIKFKSSRVYTNLNAERNFYLEEQIDEILKQQKEVN